LLHEDRETSEAHGTNHQAGAGWPMLYASEGLTFGLRPSALGLRSSLDSIQDPSIVNGNSCKTFLLASVSHEIRVRKTCPRWRQAAFQAAIRRRARAILPAP
jgi:hypothetical protein